MSQERTYPMTAEGLENLRAELQHMQTVKRPEIADRLRRAIAQGDLSENAEYHDAKEQQAFVEGRMLALKEMIAGAVVIESEASPDGKVVLGSRVTVADDDGQQQTYALVGPAEANPREGRISNESPLGKALLGAHAGDEVRVAAPEGDIVYKIVTVA